MTTCASELLERGMQKMAEMGLVQCREDVFEIEDGALVACCALGAMILGMDEDVSSYFSTMRAARMLVIACPILNSKTRLPRWHEDVPVINAIHVLNDGIYSEPLTLPDILAWLKSWEQDAAPGGAADAAATDHGQR